MQLLRSSVGVKVQLTSTVVSKPCYASMQLLRCNITDSILLYTNVYILLSLKQAALAGFDKEAVKEEVTGNGSSAMVDGDGEYIEPVKKYNKSSFFDEVHLYTISAPVLIHIL
jgi:hypothetical protein